MVAKTKKSAAKKATKKSGTKLKKKVATKPLKIKLKIKTAKSAKGPAKKVAAKPKKKMPKAVKVPKGKKALAKKTGKALAVKKKVTALTVVEKVKGMYSDDYLTVAKHLKEPNVFIAARYLGPSEIRVHAHPRDFEGILGNAKIRERYATQWMGEVEFQKLFDSLVKSRKWKVLPVKTIKVEWGIGKGAAA
jgi:hypothetical protein